MAASPINIPAMMSSQIVQRLAQQGAPQGGASPDAAGAQLSQQLSELKGADPQLLVKAVEQMKAMSLAIQVRTAFQMPEASRHLGQAQKAFDAAIKVLQQGAATANTVSSPIVNNAGMSPTQFGEPNGGADLEGMKSQYMVQ